MRDDAASVNIEASDVPEQQSAMHWTQVHWDSGWLTTLSDLVKAP